MDEEDLGVVGLEDAKNEGDEGVVGRERFSHAPRRWIEVGGLGVGGVMGLESRGPLKVRRGGARVSLVVGGRSRLW